MTTYRTIVVDGPYLTRRSFEAGRSEHATGAEALWGASTSVLLQLALEHPEAAIVVAWEPTGGPTVRRAISEDYKSRRKPAPEAYPKARDEFRELVTLLGFAQVHALGLEADDAIASVVAEPDAQPALIYSADHDLLVLVSDRVHMVRPTSGPEVITPENIVARTGHTARDWRSILILAGDPGDGIAGLPRVGKDRAARLVAACPDIVSWVLEGTPEARKGAEAVVAASDPKALQWVEVAFEHRALVVESEELVRLRVATLETTPGRRDLARAVDWLTAAGLGYLERKAWSLERDPWLEEESEPVDPDTLPF